jgi:SAM-dependent methyltransferase
MNRRNTDYSSTISHYSRLIRVHSKDYEMVGWGSKQGQERRFRVLSEVGDFSGKSLLDVGCGLGNLYAYLNSRKVQCTYTGVDINNRMIANAKERFREADFKTLDILTQDDPWPRYDFVILSGAFNLSQDKQKEFVRAMIQRMYQMARVAVAFNILSTKADFFEHGEYYARPGEMLDFCLTLTRCVILRHDYMPHDFTVYMYRDEYSTDHQS